MKTTNLKKINCIYPNLKHLTGTAALIVLMPVSHASTFWTGSTTNFSHSGNGAPGDTLVAGSVVINRGPEFGLYNSVSESSAVLGSPANTRWATTTASTPITSYNTLTYGNCPLVAGSHPAGKINTTFAVHLVAEDIYLSLKLTGWGNGADGALPANASFSYTRSTPAAANPPTVSLTGPTNGTVLAAPASLKLTATAAVSGGTVTNVKFFASGGLLGSVTSSPFNLTSSPLAAGSYSLTAVATAGGISTTSAPPAVISVVTPTATTLSGTQKTAGGKFLFSYNANPGLTYLVQSSTDLVTWSPVITNVPNSSPVSVTNSIITNSGRYFRVGRLPNP